MLHLCKPEYKLDYAKVKRLWGNLIQHFKSWNFSIIWDVMYINKIEIPRDCRYLDTRDWKYNYWILEIHKNKDEYAVSITKDLTPYKLITKNRWNIYSKSKWNIDNIKSLVQVSGMLPWKYSNKIKFYRKIEYKDDILGGCIFRIERNRSYFLHRIWLW